MRTRALEAVKPVARAARGPGALLQRKCACGGSPGLTGECEECRRKRLQRRPSGAPGLAVAPPIVHRVLGSAGRALDPAPRARMEAHFGHDFGRVRVHADALAAASASAVQAEAYTVGQAIAFAAGRFAPDTPAGRALLAHELAHVVQQDGSSAPAGELPITDAGDGDERQAEAAARGLSPAALGRAGSRAVQRRSLWQQIKGLFRGDDIPEAELRAYLEHLRTTGAPEGYTDSDNKARAVVRLDREENQPLNLTPRLKVILIREMQEGVTGGEDERAILELLGRANDADLRAIFGGTNGIDVDDLFSDFQGGPKRELRAFFDDRFEGGVDSVRSKDLRIQRGTPHDRMVVRRARTRLELLERYVAEATEMRVRQTRIQHERRELSEGRERMDQDPESERRGQVEPARITGINRRPLGVEVTEEQVLFRVRFQARFEGRSAAASASDFATLRSSLQEAIERFWNQDLRGAALGGRQFAIDPEITLVDGAAPRDLNAWLITVRPSNQGQVNYPGCQFDQLPQGVPSSATDSTCDGGVMSIPPAHLTNSGVLAHELLHLFGFLDRYVIVEHRDPTDTRTVELQKVPMRETGDRQDLLGSEDARVLREDLGLLFEQLGVYEQEASRGLTTLRQLGPNLAAVEIEIERLREIIRLRHDPRSLIQPRTDFNDAMRRSADDI